MTTSTELADAITGVTGAINMECALADDAAAVAALLSTGFAPEVSQLLIHGCNGAAEYIRMLIECGSPAVESVFFVARFEGSVLGATELRRQPERLFLNYIGVDPNHRGKRIGAALLRTSIAMSGVTHGQIALDVLDDNTRALAWYRRLGFAVLSSADLVEISPPPRTRPSARAYISGLPQADLCQHRFGFSQFKATTSLGTFSVGRIGDSWFRLTEVAAIDDPAIFAALNQLDPRRRIFAVVPMSSVPAARTIRPLARTHRMEMDIGRLSAVLSHDR